MIKNVIFDLGRVIYTFWPREDLVNLGFSEERADLFTERVFGNPIWLEYDRGMYSMPELVNKLSEDFPDMEQDLKRVFDEGWVDRVITIMPPNLEFFYEVKKRGFGIYILTNFPEDSFAHCRARDAFFDDADGIVVSAHEKLVKPEPEIYHCILNRYNLVPEESLFIDDNPTNIAVAKELGLHGIIFNNLEQGKREFEAIVGAN